MDDRREDLDRASSRGREHAPSMLPPVGLDIRGFNRFLQRRHRIIITLGALFGTLLAALSLLQTPTYSASALIMIAPERAGPISADQLVNSQSPDTGLIDSQIVLIKSRKLSADLVDRLKLVDDPLWNPTLEEQSSLKSTIKTWLADVELPEWVPLRDKLKGTDKPASVASAARIRELTIDRVNKAIEVKREGLTYVLRVTATSTDQNQPAKLANAMVDAYFDAQMKARADSAQMASGWLAQRLTALKTELRDQEAAVETYRAQKGLLTASGTTLTEQQVTEIQGAVVLARSDLAEREARFRQVQDLIASGRSADAISSAVGSETMRELRSKEADLVRRQADYEGRYGPMHPSVTSGRAELEGIRSQIRAEVGRLSESLRNEADVARARVATLEGTQNAVQGQLASNNSGLIRLRELERDAAATRTVYEGFLNRYQELSEAGTIRITSARLISDAAVPLFPSSISLPIALIAGLLLGGVFGVGAGLTLDLMNEGIDNSETAEREVAKSLTLIPILRDDVLSSMMKQPAHPTDYLLEKPMSAFAESFRSLRTALFYSGYQWQSRVTAITSAMPDEGKTTVSLCVARICAMAGQKVIVVDCDFRRRSVKEVMGINAPYGLQDVLEGRVHWKSAIVIDEATGLHVIPALYSAKMAEDAFGGAAMSRLLEELRAAYGQVILDCPPVMAVADSVLVGARADQVAIVIRHGITPAKIASLAVDRLKRGGAKVAGVVFNFVDPRLKAGGISSEIDYQERYGKYYLA